MRLVVLVKQIHPSVNNRIIKSFSDEQSKINSLTCHRTFFIVNDFLLMSAVFASSIRRSSFINSRI